MVSNEDARSQIRLRLAQLRGTAFADAMAQYFSELEEERRRSFPYVDPGLFVLIGARLDRPQEGGP